VSVSFGLDGPASGFGKGFLVRHGYVILYLFKCRRADAADLKQVLDSSERAVFTAAIYNSLSQYLAYPRQGFEKPKFGSVDVYLLNSSSAKSQALSISCSSKSNTFGATPIVLRCFVHSSFIFLAYLGV
jgi:hypothetical protein